MEFLVRIDSFEEGKTAIFPYSVGFYSRLINTGKNRLLFRKVKACMKYFPKKGLTAVIQNREILLECIDFFVVMNSYRFCVSTH